MAVPERDKIVIRRIIEESVTTRDDLIQKMNLFFSDTNDVVGIIGWKILIQIAEINPHCREFIAHVPDEFEIHREIGEYIQNVLHHLII